MALNLGVVTNIFMEEGWHEVGECLFASNDSYVLGVYDNQEKIMLGRDGKWWTLSRWNAHKQRFALWNNKLVRWDEMMRLLSGVARSPSEFVRDHDLC